MLEVQNRKRLLVVVAFVLSCSLMVPTWATACCRRATIQHDKIITIINAFCTIKQNLVQTFPLRLVGK